jgi:AraC-like DNA-binding protein
MKKALSVIYIRPLLEAVEAYAECSAAELLQRAQIQPSMVQKSTRFLNLHQYIQLVDAALSTISASDLSCRLIDDVAVTQHGLLGLLVMCGFNLRHAIKALLKFYRIQVKVINLDFYEDDDTATLVITPTVPLGAAEEFTLHIGLLALCKAKQQLVGDGGFQDKLYFTSSAENYASLAAYLQPNATLFNQPDTKIVFPKSHLDLKINSGHQPTFDYLVAQCEKVIDDTDLSMVDKVRSLLLKAEGKFPTQQELAGLLSVSSRTLSRQLSREGCTYQFLLDQERMSRAKQILLETDFTVTHIALQLNFTDASHFSKAFKRHTGVTPLSYRSMYAEYS